MRNIIGSISTIKNFVVMQVEIHVMTIYMMHYKMQ